MLNQKIQTFFLTISANIEEDSLLVAIFEVRISSIVDKQFHDLIRKFVIDKDGRKVESGLPGLSLESIDKYAIVFLEKSFDFLDCTG